MLSLGIVSGLVVCIYAFRKYRELQWGVCKSNIRMDGKVVIITGSNSGIGKETAKELAKRGAIVILACRNQQSTQNAIKEIRCATGNGDLIFMELDLGNLDSIKKFASHVCEKFSHIDILINNAGVYIPPEDKSVTSNGIESHFGVNHLGHFYLTNLLLDKLKESEGSRIVIVSSMLHTSGEIDLDTLGAAGNLSLAKQRNARNAFYSDSKLCNILHAQELKKRLVGSKTSVFVLCPGFVYTGLFRYSAHKFGWIKKLCFLPIALCFMRTPKQGAQTSVYCSASEELNGVPFGFFRDCKMADLTYAPAKDAALASRLWDFSETMLAEFSDSSDC